MSKNCYACGNKQTLEFCHTCGADACTECMYLANPKAECNRHNFLLEKESENAN